MAIIRTMYKKAKNPLYEVLEAAAKKSAERVIANYDRKMKEALIKKTVASTTANI